MGLWDEPEQRVDGLATAVAPKKPEIAKIRYTHDAIIDEILIKPEVSQGELSLRFGFTQAWMSIIINSDAFQERLRERKGELVDPKITASIEDRLNTLAKVSLDALLERVEKNKTLPLKTMELVHISKLGVGDRANRPAGPVQQNNMYVVALPGVSVDSDSWRKTAQGRSLAPPPPGGISNIIEMDPGV